MMQNDTWRLYWRDGSSTDITGTSFPNALSEGGFSGPPPENLVKWVKVEEKENRSPRCDELKVENERLRKALRMAYEEKEDKIDLEAARLALAEGGSVSWEEVKAKLGLTDDPMMEPDIDG